MRLVKEEGAIYKLVGSILLPQERQEAIANVAKRVEFIQSELYATGCMIRHCPSSAADAWVGLV